VTLFVIFVCLEGVSRRLQTNAQDYFIVTPRAIDWASEMPPIVIGRVAYDNWLVDFAVHHMDTVDATLTVKAVHQVRCMRVMAVSFLSRAVFPGRCADHWRWELCRTCKAT
jgi:hypothetical protein